MTIVKPTKNHMTTIQFDGVTKLDTFLERDDSNRLYPEVIREITWLQCDWGHPSCAASYVYGATERKLTPKASLDDLEFIVETVLETKVLRTWLWCYADGNEHMCYRNVGGGYNALHIFIGTTRKLFIHDGVESEMYVMRHGDAVFVPKSENTPDLQCSVPSNDNVKSCTLHICMLLEDPYSFRYRNIGTVHLLGRGEVDVTYDTRVYPNGLPEGMTVTILPTLCVPPDSNHGSLRLVERPQMGIFAGITFTMESLMEMNQHLVEGET